MSAVDRLYDLGAYGVAAYARARFRVRALGERFELAPRTLIVSSHRSDDDVPVLVACLYSQAHGRWRRNPRLHFAVRDDLFVPGFFAGYPKRLPAPLRRALFRLDVGPVLRTQLPCHPIRSATRLRLADFLREHPDDLLAELLPAELAAPFGAARTGRDALRAEHAQELWREVTPEDRLRLRELLGEDIGKRDRLPYTERFDQVADRFNKSLARPLAPHLIWRLIATLAK